MDDLIIAIANYKYKSPRMRKLAHILRKTKNKRIVNKALNNLFLVYLEESNTRLSVRVMHEGKKYVHCNVLDHHTKEEVENEN